MQLQSEVTDTRPQMWTSEEIRELILYTKSLQQELEDKNAQLIAMNAKLANEEAKVRKLSNLLKVFTNG